jgi:hypothetical protein
VKRRLFNAGALVSLVLCVALSALWARSYWRSDTFYSLTSPGSLNITSQRGLLSVTSHGSATLRWPRFHYWNQEPRAPIESTLLYFQWDMRPPYRRVQFPHWVVVLPLAAVPGAWLRQRFTRSELNVCRACGYDLRGTPGSDSGDRSGTPSKTCPECGELGAEAAIPDDGGETPLLLLRSSLGWCADQPKHNDEQTQFTKRAPYVIAFLESISASGVTVPQGFAGAIACHRESTPKGRFPMTRYLARGRTLWIDFMDGSIASKRTTLSPAGDRFEVARVCRAAGNG